MNKTLRNFYGISALRRQGLTYQERGERIHAMKGFKSNEPIKPLTNDDMRLISAATKLVNDNPISFWARVWNFIRRLFKSNA